MQTLRRVAAVLALPVIVYVGVACERETPMGTRSPARAVLLSNDPTTRWVNGNASSPTPPGTSCDNPGYSKIQDAVDASSPGDRINVCPGTYVEQVTISVGKDNLSLRSTKQWAAVIKAPTVMAPDVGADAGKFTIVHVTGAQNVTILAFTITGPGPANCGSLHYGVRVDDGGSADILGNDITDIRDLETAGQLSGCQNGMGVVIGGHFNDAFFSNGSARIEGNVVEHYQKNGVVVGGAGSNALVRANRVLGFGPALIIAQNGIEVLQDATAEVEHNFISGHQFTPQFVTPTGMLLVAAGTVDINHNTLAQNDVDMYAELSSTPGSLTHNRARASTFDGIVVDLANNVTVGENFTEQNGGAGIGLYEGAGSNTLENNQIERNSTTFNSTTCPISDPPCFGGGILLHDASNNAVTGNHIRNNGTFNGFDNTDGIRVNAPSTGNSIQGNHLRGNVTHDCHDASTGNNWVDNNGQTSVPTGLCDPDQQDDLTVTAGWDPTYAWYSSYQLDIVYDWVSLYSAIDAQIDNLLQLLPPLGLGFARRASP